MPPELSRRGPNDAEPGAAREPMADKPNLDVVLGCPGGLRRRDDDFLAALLGNAVLGQSTLSSRLGRRLRDREGLTYGVVSRFFGASLVDGPWATTFSVAPTELERALTVCREEIAGFVADGPTEAELADERAAMAGSYRVSLATPSGVARELARLARHGLPLAVLDALPERILGTTRDEVVAATVPHIGPESLSVAVAGELVEPGGNVAASIAIMLRELDVRDLGIIEAVHLELPAGFVVLTGETGAGKSLLVQSLQLLAGERADAEQVRAGASASSSMGASTLRARRPRGPCSTRWAWAAARSWWSAAR